MDGGYVAQPVEWRQEVGLYTGRRRKGEGTVEWRGDMWLSQLRGGRFWPVEGHGPWRKSR